MLGRTSCIMYRGSCVAARRTSAIGRHMSTLSEEPSVLFESTGCVRSYVLNRPKKLNSLDRNMLNLLRPKIEEWNRSELCKVVVGRGNGRAFCAGGDVVSVIQDAANLETRPRAIEFFKLEFEVDYMLATISKPYVVIMDGFTMGGGVGLSALAPFRIATENTEFAMPETKIGYSPDVGATYFLNKLDDGLGTYLALTGSSLKGRAVYFHGLATHYIPSRRIPALLEALSNLDDPSPQMINNLLDQYYYEPDSDEPPISLTGSVHSALESSFRTRPVEKILAALESYTSSTDAAVSAWAKETIAALDLRSPTSLRIALNAIRSNRNYELIDALHSELGIATALCNIASPDFATGVKAVLLDKTRGRPAWSPSTLKEIPDDLVDRNFFSSQSPYIKPKPELDIPDGFSMHASTNKFTLPNAGAVRRYIINEFSTGGVTRDQVIQHFEESTNWKGGVREKVLEILDRRTTLKKHPNTYQEFVHWLEYI